MHITKHLSTSNKPLFSYEIVPPLRSSTSIQQVFDIIDKLLPYNPKWINVTTHASSLLYVENPDGTISKRIHKKRPGTIGICGVIQNKYNIDAVAVASAMLIATGSNNILKALYAVWFGKKKAVSSAFWLIFLGVATIGSGIYI